MPCTGLLQHTLFARIGEEGVLKQTRIGVPHIHLYNTIGEIHRGKAIAIQ